VLTPHVTSIELRHRGGSTSIVTRSILQRLKDCPQLTSLHLAGLSEDDQDALMQNQSDEEAVDAFKGVLPTQLKSFAVLVLCSSAEARALGSVLYAAVVVMPQLIDLSIGHIGPDMDLQAGVLTQLPQLRKLTLSRTRWTSELLAELKQLSRLRILSLDRLDSAQLNTLCAPPAPKVDLRSLRREDRLQSPPAKRPLCQSVPPTPFLMTLRFDHTLPLLV
jgi:hypothetical protein